MFRSPLQYLISMLTRKTPGHGGMLTICINSANGISAITHLLKWVSWCPSAQELSQMIVLTATKHIKGHSLTLIIWNAVERPFKLCRKKLYSDLTSCEDNSKVQWWICPYQSGNNFTPHPSPHEIQASAWIILCIRNSSVPKRLHDVEEHKSELFNLFTPIKVDLTVLWRITTPDKVAEVGVDLMKTLYTCESSKSEMMYVWPLPEVAVKTNFDLAILPPTEGAAPQHSFRA